MTDVKPLALSLSGFDELYGSDTSLENDGAPMAVPGKEGWFIWLRSSNSAKVRELASSLAYKHLPVLQAKRRIDPKDQDKDNVELLARAIVTKWVGFDGHPCTQDTVRAVMRQWPAFREVCTGWSNDRGNYQQRDVEAIEGNSSIAADA